MKKKIKKISHTIDSDVSRLLKLYSNAMTNLYKYDKGDLNIPIKKGSDFKINTDEYFKILNK
jgi:hypothetical protein